MDSLSSLLEDDSALEPMLQMAEDCASSNISTIRTLVMKVLTDPQIHSGFDQIKQALRQSLSSSAEGEIMLRTLDLFSYGSYKDYKSADSGQYLSLTDAQLFKLRQLTVLSLVQQSCLRTTQVGRVSYDTLQQELGMEEVEDLVVSCIYSCLIMGKLCQKTRALVVSSEHGPPCRSRDVPPSQTGFLLETLKGLAQRLDDTMARTEHTKNEVQARKDAHDKFWRQAEDRKQKVGAVASSSSGASDVWGTTTGSGSFRRSDVGRSARSSKRSRGGLAGDSVGRY
mmetsp:Transcript_27830/g.64464  ORF Transcript_27830/g.64464 Transcript_27830/m.64464 type:complete len:283 (+) Transcript_27830:83-931(+)|eukprot:CAMPEP_0116834994 /NCGR_PEP_ID=MMETSP0418-20121206/7295_1 /TAXON_ID=1158023 /ORGANISM="Astrosyne radiata, Strain 13vi08-1A" /LENGTH=282 /DNA_ID=CAMNT_0004464605 /DNA_START=78 /DNA_END=926 /DNA_ORIENTATION=-